MSELQSLVKMGISKLEDWIKENPYDEEPHDYIWESADSLTPIYNYDIMQIARDNISEIALREVEYEGDDNALRQSQLAIFDYIEGELWNYWYSERDSLLENWREEIIDWINEAIEENPELDFTELDDPEIKLWIDSIESDLSLDRDFIHETIEDNF